MISKHNLNLKKIYHLFHIPHWLFVVLFAVILLRIPSFFEPYSYGDETIYLTLGQGMRRGLSLYRDLHDNKPPLLYLTAAIAGNLFWFKAILLILSLLGITLFYKFTEKLFPKIKYFPHVSTIIFTFFTTLPFLEGNIVNAENFMIIPTVAAFYILLFKENSQKNIFISGVLFSISSLYKIPAIFDFPAIFFFWIVQIKKRADIKKIFFNSLVLFSGIIFPILLTFAYYTLKGAFGQYLTAAYLQNFGYLSSWRPDAKRDPFIIRNAPLLIRGSIILLINFLLFVFRKKVDKKFLFIVSWLSFSIFGITLSERPYPHYLLQAAAPVSILWALIFTSVTMIQVYAILPLTLFFLIPLYFRFWHYRSVNYYSNFFNLATNKISKDKYLENFGGRTKSNYEIAAIIDAMTDYKDRIFVWEDSAQVYALSKRLPPFKYIAGYHINDFSSVENTIEVFTKNPPKVIVLFKDSQAPSKLTRFVDINYLLYKETSIYQIWIYSGKYSRFISG